MTLFEPGVEIFDVTVPLGPNVPTWPTHPQTIVQPLRRVAHGNGAPVRALLVRCS